ncbi:class I SAM-dependent methyltransferase [Geodermatophilus arenarius]|uniref:Class I SAM-dependent methyltransferase n=1 Tax=Geodermatophilus arenarius TaxID=1137990 RepID=A0ABV9LJE3_9ACTN
MQLGAMVRRARQRVVARSVARSSLVRNASFRLGWVSTRRLDPLSEWGFERGTPIDRYYIERFLRAHRGLVRGRVLEVREDLYASGLGADTVDVLDIDVTNPLATVVGDVCDPTTLPRGAFDCGIITQTLQLVPDPRAALQNLLASVRPGGSILVTVPSMSRLAGSWDRWRWTAHGFEDLVDVTGGVGEVRAFGNLVTCRAFLLGAAVEELPRRVLERDDPELPLIVTAVVRPKG